KSQRPWSTAYRRSATVVEGDASEQVLFGQSAGSIEIPSGAGRRAPVRSATCSSNASRPPDASRGPTLCVTVVGRGFTHASQEGRSAWQSRAEPLQTRQLRAVGNPGKDLLCK